MSKTDTESTAPAEETALSQDGPTFEEYTSEGYPPDAYPPEGFAERPSDGLDFYKKCIVEGVEWSPPEEVSDDGPKPAKTKPITGPQEGHGDREPDSEQAGGGEAIDTSVDPIPLQPGRGKTMQQFKMPVEYIAIALEAHLGLSGSATIGNLDARRLNKTEVQVSVPLGAGQGSARYVITIPRAFVVRGWRTE